jgi:hypothetical protein
MNERQAYALAHPFTNPSQSTAPFTAVRAHARGFLLLSILAVDR